MVQVPLVSVLMTAYNREKFIGEAIESVLASTYENFELIVVDDCSEDDTVRIARQLARKDSRIQVYVNDDNLGDYPNRNRAAAYARGKYIKYLDSDDLIYPHGLEVFISAMESYPGAALCVASVGTQMSTPFPVCISCVDVLRYHFFGSGILSTGPSATMILREAFSAIGGFSGKRMIGDIELWFKLACHYDIVVAPPSLIYWRQHDGQEFFDGVRSGLYTEMTMALVNDLMNSTECTLSPIERTRVLRYFRRITSRQLLKSTINGGSFGKVLRLNKQLHLRPFDYFNAIVNSSNKI